jgi:hypothetical protein
MVPDLPQEEDKMSLHAENLPQLSAFLDQRNFVVREERQDRSFGNGFVVLEGDGFRIRIIKDRDEINIEVGQIGHQPWYAIENVLEFLTGSAVTKADIALQAHFVEVSRLMKSDLQERGYLSFEKQKTELAIQRLFSK